MAEGWEHDRDRQRWVLNMSRHRATIGTRRATSRDSWQWEVSTGRNLRRVAHGMEPTLKEAKRVSEGFINARIGLAAE